MKTEQESTTDWLPVVDFDGVEYVVDIENRRFVRFDDLESRVAFHSDRGREMAKAMLDKGWRVFTPRDLWEKKQDLAV